MINHWIDPTSSDSLAVLVESVINKMLIEHQSPVCLEIDIDINLPVPADANHVCDLVKAIVGQSLSEMEGGGDLNVHALETPGGLELEIADSGGDVEQRPRSRPMSAAALSVQMQWQNCPQGGACVRMIFPPREGTRRMAA